MYTTEIHNAKGDCKNRRMTCPKTFSRLESSKIMPFAKGAFLVLDSASESDLDLESGFGIHNQYQ